GGGRRRGRVGGGWQWTRVRKKWSPPRSHKRGGGRGSASVRYASGPTSGVRVRARIPSPQVLPPLLPVRNRGGSSVHRVCGAVLLPASRVLSAAVLRSTGVQRACDLQPARELHPGTRQHRLRHAHT